MDVKKQLEEDDKELVTAKNTKPPTVSIAGNKIPFNKQELQKAINFGIYNYFVKNDKFALIVDDVFNMVNRELNIYRSKYKQYRDCVRHILFNGYIGHCVGLPIKYSRSRSDFSANGWYGLNWFSYRIFTNTIDTMISVGIIDGIKGWKDRNNGKGDLSRFQVTDKTISQFDEFLGEQIAERIRPKRTIHLRDKDKNDVKLNDKTGSLDINKIDITEAEFLRMEKDNNLYNDFAEKQEILLPLNDATVTLDFLIKLRIQFYKGMIEIFTKEVNINSNYNSIYNNSYISNNIYPLLGTLLFRGTKYREIKHQCIPYNKNKGNKTLTLNNLLIRIKWNYVHRVFNNSSFKYGGRLYRHIIQELPNRSKAVEITPLRNLLVFNRSETVEIDFVSLFPRLIFNYILNESCPDDIYQGFADRKKLKYCLLAMLNCPDESKNKKKIIQAIRKKFIDEGYSKGDGLKDSDIQEIIDHILKKYPQLESFVGSGVGLELMRVESDIVAEVIKRLRIHPDQLYAATCHDSLIVEKQHQQLLQDTMEQVYFEWTGFIPDLTVE